MCAVGKLKSGLMTPDCSLLNLQLAEHTCTSRRSRSSTSADCQLSVGSGRLSCGLTDWTRSCSSLVLALKLEVQSGVPVTSTYPPPAPVPGSSFKPGFIHPVGHCHCQVASVLLPQPLVPPNLAQEAFCGGGCFWHICSAAGLGWHRN
jgi:hypothetical protein